MPFAHDTVPVDILCDGTYSLLENMAYQGRDDTFTVPAGFVTDLATVPRFMTWLVPIAGVHDRAAIVHDWLCTELEKRAVVCGAGVQAMRDCGWVELAATGWTPPGPQITARDTDGIFRRILRELGVGLVRRWLFWTGVRWGALANPARRAGWWKDALPVAAISLLALPFVLLPGLLTGLVVLLDNVVERIR